MRFVLFCHSLLSDWNHGNAHFLRGVVRELLARGHQVAVHEPREGWSLSHLLEDHGVEGLLPFLSAYPGLGSRLYALDELDLGRVLSGADVVIVHEWSDPALVRRLGAHRRAVGGYRLLFHDTHHRSVTAPDELARLGLEHYDGVLAFGEVVRRRYLEQGWCQRAWTWHEAADVALFRPLADVRPEADLVWIGNWGDEERSEELLRFLVEPIRRLGLSATVHGVRYPAAALEVLRRAGARHGGWLSNPQVPLALARHRLTVHVPRRPYVLALPGVPTIRVFEALACGAALVCAPWSDEERLFQPGRDFLLARDGADMTRLLKELLADPERRRALGEHGRRTVLERHTCAHRVDALLGLLAELDGERAPAAAARRARE